MLAALNFNSATPAAFRTAPPAVRLPQGQPDDTWPVEALLAYAREQLGEAGALARKTTGLVYRAGYALWLLRARLKSSQSKRGWCDFQHENNLPRTSVWEAIQLWRRATDLGLTEDKVSSIPWPEARQFVGIAAKKEKTQVRLEAEPVVTAVSEETGVAAATTATTPNQDKVSRKAKAKTASAHPAPKPKRVTNKDDQHDLTPCEIDAGTVYITAVGWKRAFHVLQALENTVGD